MQLSANLTATEFDVLARARDELASAGHGGRGAIIERAARTLGVSVQTCYRKLGAAGFDAARKRRADAGECMLSEDELAAVAGTLRASLNKKGQRMPVGTALDILHASGKLSAPVSESTVARQLYARHMHPEQLALAEPSVQLVSRHPNHVWQIDSTTGAYYYLPGGRLRWMPEDQFYKNKVKNIVRAATDLLTRYAVVDHTSHALKVRYYLGGESAENLLDFATWAMVKQDSGPMHGVPWIIMTDPGPANTGKLFTGFCERVVGRKPLHHAPGAARVTGSVEKAHDLVRMHFETRLRFFNPAEVTLARLNADVEAWAAAYCAHAVHGRHERSRYGTWMEIMPEQLRVAASLAALREAAVSEPETRRVSNDRRIPFKGRTYDLNLVPGVIAGLKVTLQVNAFRDPAIDVLFTCPDTGEQTWHVVAPMERDRWGFGPGPVIGEEMRGARHSAVDEARNRLTKEAYALPTIEEAERARRAHAQAYAGTVDAMADVRATPIPTYLPRRGTALDAPARQVAAVLLPVLDACVRLKARLGAAYTPQVYAWVEARFPAGVPEDQLEGICAQFAQQPVVDNGQQLRAVGGAT